MGLNFPASPTVGQKYPAATLGLPVYTWDGVKWTTKKVESAPASDAAPLVDGDVSSGAMSPYSRGDHVHPTDTTRVQVNSPAYDMLLLDVPFNVTGRADINTLRAGRSATIDNLNVTTAALTSVRASTIRLTGTATFNGTAAFSSLTSTYNYANAEIGARTKAGSPSIDFRSSGNPSSFDARIVVTGGDTGVGHGTMQMVCTDLLVPTAANGDNSDKIASTAFVKANSAPAIPYLPLSGGTISGNMVIAGADMRTYRSDGTGVIYLSTTGDRYLYWDGTNYSLYGIIANSAAGRLWGTNDHGFPITNARLAYAGDYTQTIPSGLVEPYGGAGLTGSNGFSYNNSTNCTYRYRYMQNYSTGWYTIGFA